MFLLFFYCFVLARSGLFNILGKVKVAQSGPTLCNPMDCRVHGILQARTLEWVTFPFFRRSSNPGIKPRSPTLQADSLPAEPLGKPNTLGRNKIIQKTQSNKN